MTDITDRLLQHTAERATRRPTYLGWVLARYMEAEGLEWPAVAAMLGGNASFVSLALCLRPRPERFAADVRQIADKFGVDATVLARIARLVDAGEAMKNRSPGEQEAEHGTLLAAREQTTEEDRDDGEPAR